MERMTSTIESSEYSTGSMNLNNVCYLLSTEDEDVVNVEKSDLKSPRLSKEFKNSIKIYVGQAVFDLLIKTIFLQCIT